MKYRHIFPLLFAVFTLVLTAIPTSAQAPESSLNLNAYHCPAGYDQVSDCTKLGDVYVDVYQDGQYLDQVVSSASEGATLDLTTGAYVELIIAGGVPEGTALEASTLTFDVVEGVNAVTLVFVDQEVPAPSSYLSVVAWFCPANYEYYADSCTRLGDVYVDVTQNGEPLAQIKTLPVEVAVLDLQEGADIELTIAGGVPERSYLASDLDLSFTAVPGENPVMITFISQEEAPDPHADANALVVEALVCPVEYAGNNYADDCVGEAEIGVTVTRDADGYSVSDVAGAEGTLGIQGLGEGTYTIELGVPGDAASFLTVCGTPDGFEPRQVSNPDSNLIGVYLGPTETLTCTFFIIPADLQGAPAETPVPAETPAPAQPTTSPTVTGLPSTGTGEAAASGSVTNAFWYTLGTCFLIAGAGALIIQHRRD